MTYLPDLHERLRASAEAFAEQAALAGHHVSVRVYEPYGDDDDQPDPIVDVWRSALPAAIDPSCREAVPA